MISDNDFTYTHAPGLRDTFAGVRVSINSEGFRGPEFKIIKEPGRKRIMVLGDSVVFGWGVSQDAILTARLQESLYDLKPNSEVIACGVGSWNTRSEFEFLKKRGVLYAPDILVLLITSNDLEPKESGHTDVPREKLRLYMYGRNSQTFFDKVWSFVISHIVRRSYMLTYALHSYTIHTYKDTMRLLYDEKSPCWEDARRALGDMVRLCRENKISLVVYLYGQAGTSDLGYMERTFGTFLMKEGVPYHTFSPDIFDAKYGNSSVDSHRNGAANKRMADDILNTLKPLL